MLACQDRKRIREYIAEQNLMAAIELVIHPHVVLVYEVDSQWGKVYILRVLHTAQKWPSGAVAAGLS